MNLQYANYLLNAQEKDFKGEKRHKQKHQLCKSSRAAVCWGGRLGCTVPAVRAVGDTAALVPFCVGESGVTLCGAAVPSAWHRATPPWRVCGPR